jgi:GNAT superfamily N-acetyltransferase
MNLNLDVTDEQTLVLPTGIHITYRWKPSDPNWIDLLALHSKQRGQGHASRALEDLIAFATSNGLSISVYAKQWAGDTGGLNTLQLADFYARHGFVTGDDYRPDPADLDDDDHIGVDMWWQPPTVKVSQ